MSVLLWVLSCCCVLGFLLMFFGVVWANVAVQEMRGVRNESRPPNEQLRWHDAIQKVAQNVIDKYRSTYPDGPLNRKLKTGYCVSAIGGFLMIGSAFALKFT